MATTSEKIKISLEADVSQTLQQLEKIKTSLKDIIADNKIKINSDDLKKLIKELNNYEKAIKNNLTIGDNNKLNVAGIKEYEKNVGSSLSDLTGKINDYYKQAGKTTEVTTDVGETLTKLEAPANKAKTAIDKLGTSLYNSLRYNLVNNFVDSFLSKGGEIVSLLEEVDEKLTQIQIVSGKSSDSLAGVRESGISMAKDLSSSVSDVLSAYEIYYQQGLSKSEAQARTQATVMAANVSNQSVSTTAEQATAVLNGFNISSSETVSVLGKLAQIGAKTATDFSEIATAMQKVASASDVAGLSLNDTLAAMATISSVTREAPETIGTSLNAILGRIGNLKIDDEYTSAIEKMYKSTNSGLTLFDEQTGLLKDASTILSELAEKWNILDINQKRAITSQLAGTRQANRLLALMENWDMFEQYQEYAADSGTALEDQNAIYERSLEAAQNRYQTAWDNFWLNLFNEDALTGIYDFAAEFVTMFDNATESAGGLLAVIRTISGLMSKTIGSALGDYAGAKAQASYLRGSVKTSESQKRFNNTQNLVDEGLKVLGADNVKLINQYERLAFLTQTQREEYEKISEKLINITKQAKQYSDIINSSNYNLDYRKVSQDKKTGEIKVEQDKITSALDFKNYAENMIKNLNQSIEREQIGYGFKAAAENKKTTNIAAEYQKQGIEVDTNLIEKNRIKFEDLLRIVQQFGETDNEYIQKLIDTIKLEIDVDKNDYTQLIQSYKDIYKQNSKTPQLKKEIQNLINLQNTGNIQDLDVNQQALLKRYNEAEQKKSQLSTVQYTELSLRELLKKGSFNFKDYGMDSRLEENFYTSLITSLETFLQQLLIEQNPTTGENIKQAASREQKAKNFISENSAQASELVQQANAINSARDWNKITQQVISFSQAAGSAITGLTQIMDENLNTQEKLSAGVNALGASLSAFPGITGAVGFAISTLGPLFIEVFNIGADESKKLEKQIENLNDSIDSLTLNFKEQRSEFSNINSLYADLVKQYEEQAFTYDQLSEEQQQSYEQVADYISKYAPELVKYYDSEGRAVIDLTDKYNTLANTKKTYLETSLDYAAVQTYAPIKEDSGENAELIIKNYGKQLENLEAYRKKIAEYQQKSLESGKDYTEEISKLQEKITNAESAIAGIATSWDNSVIQPLTQGNYLFHSLSTELQNSVLSMSSYNSYLSSDFGLDTETFTSKIEVFINTLSSLSTETQKKFEDMDESVRNAIFSITNNMSLSNQQLSEFLNNITEESFIRGDFLQAYEDQTSSRRDELSNQRDALREERKTLRKNREEPARNVDTTQKPDSFAEYYGEIDRTVLSDEKALEQNEEQIDSLTEQIESLEEEADVLRSQWVDSLREMASESAEAYNEIAENYQDLMDELERTPETADNYDEMLERAQEMYAVLQGDNQDYFNSWKDLNQETLNDISETYGINANNYKTYNEYMSALDEQRNKLKLLYEIAAAEGTEGLEKALFENKKENLLKSLTAQKRNSEAALLLASNESQQKVVMDAIEKKNILLSLQEKLKKEKESGATSVQISADEARALEFNNKTMLNNMKSQLNSTFGAGTVAAALGISGVASLRGGYETSIDTAIKSVEEALGRIDSFIGDAAAELGGAYNDALNSIGQISAMESYIADLKYNTTDFGKYDVNFKPITGSGGSGSMNPINGSGDKDKGSSGSDKTVDDMKLELDVLRPYIIAIEELEHQLDILAEKKEQVWGDQYVKYLEEELDLNKKLLAVNEGKLQAAKEYANVLKVQLQAQGATFTDYGAISNYNQLLESRANAANALSGDAKEEAQKAVEELQELMDKYEEYALETVRDIEKEILEAKNEIAEIAQEQIEYYVEIIVDSKDNKNDLIDFLAEVQKYKKGEVNFSIDVSNNAEKLIESINALEEIESKTSVDNLIKQVEESADLEGMTDKQLEIIQNRIDELQDLGSELIDFEEAFSEAFVNAFDEALDLLDKQIAKYDNILDQYNYILDLADKMNNKDLDFNSQTYDKIIDIYKNNLEASKQLAEDIKASRDQFEVGTEDWQIANEKYLEAQASVIEQEQALTDALEDKYDSTVSIGRDKIENILFNGGTLEDAEDQLEKLNELRDKYLDKEEKIYSLDKMKYNIMQDMKEYEYDPEARKQLENWMNQELEYLNNKKDLTEEDLELAEKQYAVLKAQIDMENAYNNKKYTAVLQRNASGTYGYMYVQDTSMYEAASQSYRDAIDDLYNYSQERNEALQEENIKLKQEALEEYDKIVEQLKAGMITSEEATKMLQETFNELQENLRKNGEEQELISQNAVASTQLQILMNEMMNTESMNRIQELSSQTQQIINDNLTAAGMDYDDFVNSKLYQELDKESMFTQDVIEEWTKLDELINNDMDAIADSFDFDNEDSMISQVVNSINSAYEDFNQVVNDAFQNAIDRQEDLYQSTSDLNNQMADLNSQLAEEIGKVTELKTKYNELRDSVTASLDAITNSLNKLLNAKQNVENASKNPGTSGSGGGGGSGGSSGGGGGSGGNVVNLAKGSSVRVKPGRRWYYDSRGTNPSGPTDPYANRTLYIVNTSSNAYPYALGSTTSISSALGWVKKDDLVGYDTGGYTGDWAGSDGKLALLHKKELILKESDTENLLEGLKLSNQLVKENVKSYKIDNNKTDNNVNYNSFNIEFPNATNSNEILKAFEGLPNIAKQYLGRKK